MSLWILGACKPKAEDPRKECFYSFLSALLRVSGHGQRPVSGWLGYSASNLGDERLNHFAMQNGGQALRVGW
jgi:hypothetical protein